MESVNNVLSARGTERHIDSMLYERLFCPYDAPRRQQNHASPCVCIEPQKATLKKNEGRLLHIFIRLDNPG